MFDEDFWQTVNTAIVPLISERKGGSECCDIKLYCFII